MYFFKILFYYCFQNSIESLTIGIKLLYFKIFMLQYYNFITAINTSYNTTLKTTCYNTK